MNEYLQLFGLEVVIWIIPISVTLHAAEFSITQLMKSSRSPGCVSQFVRHVASLL